MFHVRYGCAAAETLNDVEVGFADDFPTIDSAVGLRNEGPCLLAKSFLAHGLGGDKRIAEFLCCRLKPPADFIVEDETIPAFPLRELAQEVTIRGRFVRTLLERAEREPEKAEICLDAARAGLRALRGDKELTIAN